MAVFDIIVLGCGGGPDEGNLSSYLLKTSESTWSDGIVALEAGSGLGALARILKHNADIFGVRRLPDSTVKPYAAAEALSWIRCYLITHAHMDHINSLVLSAGSLDSASRPRRIHAVTQTLQDIETVFSDRLWPNLASWEEDDSEAMLVYSRLNMDSQYTNVAPGISVLTLPLSHGKTSQHRTYDSAAFFIRHDLSKDEFLFFGDVEPDSLSANPRTHDVWRAAAPKIPDTLSTIFIECSYPTGRPDGHLYGHLSPKHLRDELVTLADEVVKSHRPTSRQSSHILNSPARKRQRTNPVSMTERRNALAGLRVYIIHCKADFNNHWDRPIHQVIADQVRAMVQDEQLGAEVIAAEQGMTIHI